MIASYRRQGLQLAQVREYQQMNGRVEPELVAVSRAFEEALEESIQGNRTALWFDTDQVREQGHVMHYTCVGPSRFVIWAEEAMGALSGNWFVRVGEVPPVVPLVGRLEVAVWPWVVM